MKIHIKEEDRLMKCRSNVNKLRVATTFFYMIGNTISRTIRTLHMNFNICTY